MLRDWLEKIASDKNLRGEDFRVLLVLFANAEGKGVEIAQTEIAQKLKIKKPRVSRAIGRLTSLGIINKKLMAGKLVGYEFLIEGSN